MPAKTFTKHPLSKYQPKFSVDAYALAKAGNTDNTIAQTLGVTASTLSDWRKRYPEFEYALTSARSTLNKNGVEVFREYVYQRLPEALRDLWDKIELWEEAPNAFERITALLSPHGTNVRQSLFMHALVSCNFNQSEACAKLCIPMTTVATWAQSDPDFRALMDQLVVHKKDFFEGALMKLVAEGNTLAIIFANRTINRDRGYNPSIKVEHSGGMTVTHQRVVSVDQLDLSLEQRRELMRKVKAVKVVSAEPATDEAAVRAPVALLES